MKNIQSRLIEILESWRNIRLNFSIPAVINAENNDFKNVVVGACRIHEHIFVLFQLEEEMNNSTETGGV